MRLHVIWRGISECSLITSYFAYSFLHSIHGFKSIGCVQLFPSPSELSSAPEKSRRELKQETSSAKGSIAIALAGVVLLAAFVPYFLS
jgi:hypothetical protein